MEKYNLKYQLGGNTKNGHLKWNEKGLVVDKINCIGKENTSSSYKYYKCEYSLNPFKCNEIPDPGSGNIKYCNKSEEIDYSWIKYGNIGIKNLGDTCYANSYLQAILHSYSFIYHVKLLDITDNFNTLIKDKFSKTKALDLEAIKGPNGNGIRDSFMCPRRAQQDAQEYLQQFLRNIYEDDKYMLKNVDISSQYINLKITPPPETETGENISFYDNTQMINNDDILDTSKYIKENPETYKNFSQNYTYNLSIRNYFFSFITCESARLIKIDNPKIESTRHRLAFGDMITAPIPKPKPITKEPKKTEETKDTKLIECLREYFKIETMLGDNRNSKEEGLEWDRKELKLLSTPIYFIIQLKRFEFNFNGTINKISDKVEIPLELKGADLIEFMYKNYEGKYNDPGTYDLYAVTMQSGNLSFGHYYSYIRKPKFNDVDLNSGPFTPGWYEANDETFYPFIGNINKEIKDGYIFYYKKRDLDDEYPHMLGNEDVKYKYV